MEKFLNVENEWESEVDCHEVMGHVVLFLKKRSQQLLIDLKLEKQLVALV